MHYVIELLNDLLLFLLYGWGHCLNKVQELPKVSLASKCQSQDLNSSLLDFKATFWVSRRETWTKRRQEEVSCRSRERTWLDMRGSLVSQGRMTMEGWKGTGTGKSTFPGKSLIISDDHVPWKSGRVEAVQRNCRLLSSLGIDGSSVLGKWVWRPWATYTAVGGEWWQKEQLGAAAITKDLMFWT